MTLLVVVMAWLGLNALVLVVVVLRASGRQDHLGDDDAPRGWQARRAAAVPVQRPGSSGDRR